MSKDTQVKFDEVMNDLRYPRHNFDYSEEPAPTKDKNREYRAYFKKGRQNHKDAIKRIPFLGRIAASSNKNKFKHFTKHDRDLSSGKETDYLPVEMLLEPAKEVEIAWE